jgi:SAM-dependent methyltransferase
VAVGRQVIRGLRRRLFPGSANYWERRYRRGGTSGSGSYGDHARFKADFLNEFVARNQVESVVEFGCGDGNQLRLAHYPRYLGLDVSARAVAICRELFADDASKRFELYDSGLFTPRVLAQLSLSLDVILHLVEPDVFRRHLDHLFAAAERAVVIYGSDVDQNPSETAAHVRWRAFSPTIEERFPDWTLSSVTRGLELDSPAEPRADFFVYRPV